MHHAPRFLQISEAARNQIKEVSINSVKDKLDQKHSFFLVDVREDSEWTQNHLPSAIHLGKGIIERDIEKTIPNVDAEIVLYCGGGYRSALAAESLKKMGYNNVYSMAGGIRSWHQAGFPLE